MIVSVSHTLVFQVQHRFCCGPSWSPSCFSDSQFPVSFQVFSSQSPMGAMYFRHASFGIGRNLLIERCSFFSNCYCSFTRRECEMQFIGSLSEEVTEISFKSQYFEGKGKRIIWHVLKTISNTYSNSKLPDIKHGIDWGNLKTLMPGPWTLTTRLRAVSLFLKNCVGKHKNHYQTVSSLSFPRKPCL